LLDDARRCSVSDHHVHLIRLPAKHYVGCGPSPAEALEARSTNLDEFLERRAIFSRMPCEATTRNGAAAIAIDPTSSARSVATTPHLPIRLADNHERPIWVGDQAATWPAVTDAAVEGDFVATGGELRNLDEDHVPSQLP
jgi:hypothetical protein